MVSCVPRLRHALLAVIGAGSLLLHPLHSAHAYGFVRFGFGFPVVAPFYPFYGPQPFYSPRPFYGPGVIYAPPPVIYASPPVAYTQPPPYRAVSSGRCYAGAYVCPLRHPLTVGSPCSCPTNTARAAGQAG